MTKTELKKVVTPNALQQKCIDNLDGRFLVLAGPGTGKTFTIIQRIKNMIKQGKEPESILCLTFTDAAANEMRKRIEEELDVLSTEVNVFTYHGFCSKILEEYADEFELPSNYKIITDPVSRAFIKECIDEINPVYFRTEKNDPYYYINKIKYRIAEIKQNRLTKEVYFYNLENNDDWVPERQRLERKIAEKRAKGRTDTITDEGNLESINKKINQAVELWDFYELYQKKMNKKRYLDFNDMINLVLDKFEKSNGFLHQVANKYKYILVDEYQDTNKSQNEIVFMLTHALDTQNVFVVGDDNQIIYRFQGANLETIDKFLEEFPDTQVICLKENMRSTQSILDTAYEIVKHDPKSLENNVKFKQYDINKKLVAKNTDLYDKNKNVRFYKYAEKIQEYTEIVEEIEDLINSSECPVDDDGHKKLSEIAILTKTNAEAEEFAELFKNRNIPYELKEGKNIFKIPAVNVMFLYMQALVCPDKFAHCLLQLLLCRPFSINSADYVIIDENKSKSKNFISSIKEIPPSLFVQQDKVEYFLKTFDYLFNFKSKESVKNTLLEIGVRTGIFDYYLNDDVNRVENVAGLKKLLDEAVGYSEIYDTPLFDGFVEYITALSEDDEKINTDKAPVAINAVQLSTYHSAKGKEFEYVYMPSLHQYNWESSKKHKPEVPLDPAEHKDDDDLTVMKMSDLYKLMYVGMTRAKHALRLSFPEAIDKKSRKLTKLIADVQDKLVLDREPEPFVYDEMSYTSQIAKLMVKREYDYKQEFNNLIDSKIKNFKYSASSINQYLKCPRQFLYERIFKFDGKTGNPNNASYGSAIHEALKSAVQYAQKNSVYPKVELVIKWFKQELDKLSMESFEQRKNYEGRGEKALTAYYPAFTNTPVNRLVDAEKYFKDNGTVFEGIKFEGYIDRIDLNDDGTYTIYDYKTGNNKNKDIKIGGDHEDYYNQVAFYKYYYEKLTDNKVSKTMFLYPDDFAKKNDGFVMTDEECEQIAQKIKDSVDAINRYEFEPSCNKKVCQYCQYEGFCAHNAL